jgi:hypothetical protein
MSADNTIVILETSSTKLKHGFGYITVPTYSVFRVAEVMAWDSFDWYKENQPMLVGSYLDRVFKNSTVYASKKEALEVAYKLMENIHNLLGYVEYGIKIEIFREFTFFEDF